MNRNVNRVAVVYPNGRYHDRARMAAVGQATTSPTCQATSRTVPAQSSAPGEQRAVPFSQKRHAQLAARPGRPGRGGVHQVGESWACPIDVAPPIPLARDSGSRQSPGLRAAE
jgi:hypothetical protein